MSTIAFEHVDGEWRVADQNGPLFEIPNRDDLASHTKAELIDMLVAASTDARSLSAKMAAKLDELTAANKAKDQAEYRLREAEDTILELRDRLLNVSLAARAMVGIMARDSDMVALEGYEG